MHSKVRLNILNALTGPLGKSVTLQVGQSGRSSWSTSKTGLVHSPDCPKLPVTRIPPNEVTNPHQLPQQTQSMQAVLLQGLGL